MIKRLLPWDGLGHEIVAHGGVLYIGGVVAEDTSLDMAGQADDVLRQLAKLLTAGGSSIARVLQVTIYVADLADKPDFNRARKAHFNDVNLPARAMIGVADLEHFPLDVNRNGHRGFPRTRKSDSSSPSAMAGVRWRGDIRTIFGRG